MDIIEEEKETLAQSLEDASELALRRQSFLQAYQDIKENPKKYSEAPIVEEDIPTGPVETVTVKTKQGDKDVELGTPFSVFISNVPSSFTFCTTNPEIGTGASRGSLE